MVEKLDHGEGNGILETLLIHRERTRDRYLPQSLVREFWQQFVSSVRYVIFCLKRTVLRVDQILQTNLLTP